MTDQPAAADAGLPRALGDGLTLRWATPADTEAVADHNVRFLSENPAEPEEELRNWTRDLMRGDHPTTGAGDFTVVVDEREGGKIVSSLCLISQTWAYDGIPFRVGRPEIVSTDPAYRRRGLVRAQFEAIHARSATRGERLQAITGIPWYYRQYGYELTLALGGSRRWLHFRIPPRKPDEPEAYRLRRARPTDLPLLARLYAIECASSLVTRLRDEAEWRYELTVPHEQSYGYKQFWIVEDAAGGPVGYTEARVDNESKVFALHELAVLPGHSLRAVAVFLGQQFQAQVDQLNQTRAKPLTSLVLVLGASHPAYTALDELLEQARPAYAWYIRVPDLPGFLRLIAPVLERRLAGSVMAGHSGTLRLNFYRQYLTLVFDGGRLTEVGTYTPSRLEDGDARFPDLTFLHVLLGHRTQAEVGHLYADCYANPLATVLLGILFPRWPSSVAALA